jgi:hypothetical protein
LCVGQDGSRLTCTIDRYGSFSVSESDLPATESGRLGTGELDGENSDVEQLPDGDERLPIDGGCLYSGELEEGYETAPANGSCSGKIFGGIK